MNKRTFTGNNRFHWEWTTAWPAWHGSNPQGSTCDLLIMRCKEDWLDFLFGMCACIIMYDIHIIYIYIHIYFFVFVYRYIYIFIYTHLYIYLHIYI
jgi:hypothetical protein